MDIRCQLLCVSFYVASVFSVSDGLAILLIIIHLPSFELSSWVKLHYAFDNITLFHA